MLTVTGGKQYDDKAERTKETSLHAEILVADRSRSRAIGLRIARRPRTIVTTVSAMANASTKNEAQKKGAIGRRPDRFQL